VSLRYAPATNELPFFCELFEQTSRILHDLTDGAHSIGTVQISANSMGGADADIWVHPDNDVWPNSFNARLWFPNQSLDMSQDYLHFATILAHELGHYLYDVRDEYNNDSVCLGNIATQASLMEAYDWSLCTRWTNTAGADYATWAEFFPDFTAGTAILQLGQPTEFCHVGNHDTTQNHYQNSVNGKQSCWTYIANDANHNNIPYGLTVPGAAGPVAAQPSPLPAATVCTELIPVQRFELLLDRSEAMRGSHIDQFKVGANFWVDYVNSGEELGIITDATSPTEDSARQAVQAVPTTGTTAWRTTRHTIIDELSAAGETAIADTLRMGLNAVFARGRASGQVIILFSDGLQNVGSETAEAVLPDLRAAGVRVYTIGLGSNQDAALLANIATTTGATYFPIPGDLDPTAAANAITEALIAVAGESRENGGIVSFNDVDGASPDAGLADDRVPFDWPPKGTESKPPTEPDAKGSFTFPVLISEGSSHATLGALWKDPARFFDVRVSDPAGNPVAPGPGVRQVQGAYPYGFYEVDNPLPGTWTVEVEGDGLNNTRFRTIGFEVNDRIRLEASVDRPHVRMGEDVHLRARLLTPQATPGARITAWVRTPDGDWFRIPFDEHLGGPDDSEEPFVYTATLTTNEQAPGHYLIVVDAAVDAGTFEIELDELYRLKPGLRPEDMRRTVVVPQVIRRELLGITASRGGPLGFEPIAGFSEVPPIVPPDQQEWLGRWQKRGS
jgi:hypothetical protein